MQAYTVVGKRLPRLDGADKAMGKVNFTTDLTILRMLYGKILRSPLPHAKVLNVDVSKAQRLKGVKAIITGQDTKGLKYAEYYGSGILGTPPDKYPLAFDKVRFIGDEVASVASVDEDTAQEALEIIKVDYEPLPAVFDVKKATEPTAPQIHEHAKNNLVGETYLNFGDIERGFDESDYVREDSFETSIVQHAQMEPHAVLADFDPTGKLTIYPSCMSVHSRRSLLSIVLNMPESRIRVINPYVGGAFGGKIDLLSMDICAILLSKKTQRPVKIVNTREEQFTCTRTDYGVSIWLKTGVKKDGTLVAQHYKATSNKGAYYGIGPISVWLLVVYANGIYRVANGRYESVGIYTNLPVAAPKRSHQNPIVRFAIESQMDMIAEELGMDPMELRLKNAIKTGDELPSIGKIISCGLRECIGESAKSLNWKENRGKGIGMGSTYFFGGGIQLPYPLPHSSGAFVKCNEDGTVNLIVGTNDDGAGNGSMLAQVAAEELGIDMSSVKVAMGDTETTPPDMGIFLSASACITGNAVKSAASDAKHQLFEVVSEELEVSPSDLESKGGRIYVKGSPERGISFSEAISKSVRSKRGNPILGRGYDTPGVPIPDIKTGKGPWSPTYVFASGVARVEIDRETGKVRICEIGVAHDCGFAINPMEVEGQLQGSSSMAQGNVLSEELIFEEGQALNPSFLEYKLPLSVDSPKVKAIPVETIDPKGAFGAKEAGEGSTATTVAAVANAIYDSVGVRSKKIPIAPEDILELLEK